MTESFKTLGLSGLYRSAIAFVLLLVAATWPNSGVVSAFAAEKLIEVEPQHRSDAVMITKVTLGNSEVQCGLLVGPRQLQPVTPIQAGDDWLQNLTLYLFNRTDKTIVFGQIVLAFPETGDGSFQHPLRVYNITLGRYPPSVVFSGSTGKPLPQDLSRQVMSFAPGQTLLIHVGDYIDQIRASVDNMPFTTVTKCIIRRSDFFFDDGMRWDGGDYAVPDPEHPGKFKQLDGRYFPGNESSNWPPGYHN